jgi:nitrogen fixation/metabolism regulation signal transduction histidine kinase
VELLLRARHGDTRVHGIITATGTPAPSGGLESFAGNEWFARFSAGRDWQPHESSRDVVFYIADDRSMLLGTWRDALLFYHQIDPFFVRQSQSVLEARQLFAKLRLTQGDLTRSFFLAFVIIYLVCLVITLGVALVMAERLADPIRRLVRGADAVAEGHWDTHVDARAGGETGRLVRAFNGMVERLDTQRRRLVETEKMAAWQDVARHLAHEIKNPLLPIRLTVEELRDQYQGGDANYRTMLEDSARVVGEELGHLQTLVRDFSEFAKMPELSARESSFAQLVHDVAGIYPQVESDIREDRGLPSFPFDPDQLRRVVINLYDNAVGVGATAMRVEIGIDKRQLRVAFSDNGPGIPGENLDKVFEPYFTTRSEGTGLGLAVSRNVVFLHGGSIEVSSVPGEGATFAITLPLTGPPVDDNPTAPPGSDKEEKQT